MSKRMRDVVKIDREKCNGCGACVRGCHEGALQLVDGKAALVSELMCDGLGACLPACPVGAITIERREAEPYDEVATLNEMIMHGGRAVVAAHLQHMADHGQTGYLQQAFDYLRANQQGLGFDAAELIASINKKDSAEAGAAPAQKQQGGCGCGGGCPGTAQRSFGENPPRACGCGCQQAGSAAAEAEANPSRSCGCGSAGAAPLACGCPGSMSRSFAASPAATAVCGDVQQPSALTHWPVQLKLVNPSAPHFRGSNLLLSADCAAYALGAFHSRLLQGHTLAIACPKLDQGRQEYVQKITEFVDVAEVDTITVVRMEVPCCGGLVQIAQEGRDAANRHVPIKVITVGMQGDIKDSKWI